MQGKEDRFELHNALEAYRRYHRYRVGCRLVSRDEFPENKLR